MERAGSSAPSSSVLLTIFTPRGKANAVADVYAYNAPKDEWTRLPDLPEVRWIFYVRFLKQQF